MKVLYVFLSCEQFYADVLSLVEKLLVKAGVAVLAPGIVRGVAAPEASATYLKPRACLL